MLVDWESEDLPIFRTHQPVAAAISELFLDDEVFTRQQVGYADNYRVTPQRLQEVNRMVLNEYNRYPLPQFWGLEITPSRKDGRDLAIRLRFLL